MAHLISAYAQSCGLQIDIPEVPEAFCSLPFEKYITLQSGSLQGAKNYDFYQEVVNLINPYLSKVGISIVLLGLKEDPLIQGTFDMRQKTTLTQAHYLVKNGLLHFGNDSVLAHAAGWNYKKLVALYGNTRASEHGPYWSDKENTILLESHRRGNLPSFQSQENPKTINFIDPILVAQSVLKLLGIENSIGGKSLFFGPLYNQGSIEIIPNTFVSINDNNAAVFTVRLDICWEENILAQILSSGRKCGIVSNKPINPNLLNQFKSNIVALQYEMVEAALPSFQWVKAAKSLIPNTIFFCKETDDQKLSALRLRYFEYCLIEKYSEPTKQQALELAAAFLNKNILDVNLDSGSIKFKSNKFLLSSGRIYLSMAHLAADKSISNFCDNIGDVIDSQEFWRDLNNYYLHKE